MIISVAKLKQIPEFSDVSEFSLQRKLESIEELIRSYTNNNFHHRNIKFISSSSNGKLKRECAFLKVGDTVEITDSINNGLYVVKAIECQYIKLDKDLFDCDANVVTKVEYPPSIVDGVINLLSWDMKNRDKVGIQSETISRHSVTYFNQDANNQVMGYPVSLLGFLTPYCRARF